VFEEWQLRMKMEEEIEEMERMERDGMEAE
jgi:hypothetical protein